MVINKLLEFESLEYSKILTFIETIYPFIKKSTGNSSHTIIPNGANEKFPENH
jgi:hypothetical protein